MNLLLLTYNVVSVVNGVAYIGLIVSKTFHFLSFDTLSEKKNIRPVKNIPPASRKCSSLEALRRVITVKYAVKQTKKQK